MRLLLLHPQSGSAIGVGASDRIAFASVLDTINNGSQELFVACVDLLRAICSPTITADCA